MCVYAAVVDFGVLVVVDFRVFGGGRARMWVVVWWGEAEKKRGGTPLVRQRRREVRWLCGGWKCGGDVVWRLEVEEGGAVVGCTWRYGGGVVVGGGVGGAVVVRGGVGGVVVGWRKEMQWWLEVEEGVSFFI